MNHLNVSIVKSLVRIAAAVALIDVSFVTAGVLLIVAEILGVVEELV
jgi:hypothetical protein